VEQGPSRSLSRFASSLPEGTFVSTPNSSHAIQSSEPELVVWAIARAMYPSLLHRLERAYAAGGVAQLALECQTIKAYYPPDEFDESAVNYLGRRFMATHKAAGIALLEMNVKDYPKSSRAYVSLAEAYAADGKKNLAVKNDQRALELDPKNEHALKLLKTLRQ
jgi:tetratricopeptide (TPR) repeat protein